MDLPRCLSRVLFWSLLATLLVSVATCAPESDLAIHNRLDRVLETLELIAVRQQRLTNIVEQKCGCRYEADQETDIPQTGGKVLTSNEDNIVETGQQVGASKRREEALPNVSKDFFHFNRLSTNFITGPINNLPQSDDESLNSWMSDTSVGGRDDDQVKQTLLAIGKHCESMFGSTLEELSRLTREQLGGFRLSLNKLMNRVIDHSYQYNTISNQLALIKDECSLAATSSVLTQNIEGKQQQQSRGVGETAGNQLMALRTSDISMIVRLLSEEFNQLMRNPSQRGVEDREEASRVVWLNETKVINRRLGEIDSVVKQSALLLSKLSLSSSSTDNSPQVVITYTNGNATTAVSKAPDGGRPNGTRWFAGSKVPGRSRAAGEGLTVAETARSESRSKCHSKIGLARPQSCRQLRMAGATCSGQYYVFVRGAIRHVVCDMNMDSDDEGGGWTVILRRIDKSLRPNTTLEAARPSKTNQLLEAFKAAQVDFGLDWSAYKSGFGHLADWGEFFIGLELLHELTNSSAANETCEMQLDLETSGGHELHLKFDRFALEDEGSQFRVWISGCNSSAQLCQPISRLNAAQFYTFDRPQNQSRCRADEPAPGWWQLAGPPEARAAGSGECAGEDRALFALTAPLGLGQVRANERPEPRHLYWPNWGHSDEPLRRIVMKVRRKRLAGSA